MPAITFDFFDPLDHIAILNLRSGLLTQGLKTGMFADGLVDADSDLIESFLSLGTYRTHGIIFNGLICDETCPVKLVAQRAALVLLLRILILSDGHYLVLQVRRRLTSG